MYEENKNINPWADKLQDTGSPDSPDSWKAMETLLDAAIPVRRTADYRRWVLLSILLLLLIGVCNCPAVVPGNGDSATASLKTGEDGFPVKGSTSRANDSSLENRTETEKKNSDRGQSSQGNDAGLKETDESGAAINRTKHKRNKSVSTKQIPFGATALTNAQSQSDISKNSGQHINNEQAGRPSAVESSSKISNPDSARKNAQDSLNKKAQEIAKLKKQARDSVSKKQNQNDSIQDAKGFALAIGLNQFFPVGDQDKANFNSSGTSGGISDYIPVPAAKYYFHKWFYVEAEAQFNSPQYTKTLLIGQGEKSLSGQNTVQSIFVKKLFYFNLPLSVHYSPVKNLFFGAGIQFSMLTNGVALFQNTRGFIANGPAVMGPADTVLISSTVENFKGDTSYKKLQTTEWGFLLDVNYQWKRLTLGLRYNQAFTNFVDVNVTTANVITQAHNSSLQLYLQYLIWDKRKKFMIPK
jgi:hypothetical protein